MLDIAQAFRDAGLGELVAEGEAAEPPTASPPTIPTLSMPSSESSTGAGVLVAPSNPVRVAAFQGPRVRLRRSRGRVLLWLLERPSEAQTQVRYLGHRKGSPGLSVLRTLTTTSRIIQVAHPGLLAEVSLRYTNPHDPQRASSWTTLPIPRPKAPRSERSP